MINKKALENLKQIDVSKNSEKTKTRIKTIWQKLDTAGRQEVLELADITKYAVTRSYAKGNITPRMAAAFSITQKINPLYLTGESDSEDGYSDELANDFIESKAGNIKSGKKTRSVKQSIKQTDKQSDKPRARKISAKKSTAVVKTAEPEQVSEPQKQLDKIDDIIRILSKANSLSSEELTGLNNMPEDEIIYLVKALLYRSKYNADADEIMFFVRFLLTI